MPDTLTGLPTHRDLVLRLPVAQVSALWLDIDGLIWINDQFGWDHGDRAIAAVARTLRALLESTATSLFRVAGDEFLLLLGELNHARAILLAEAAVGAIDALQIPYRRVDRVSANHLRVNAAVLSLDPKSFAASISQHGLESPIRESVANAVYQEKLRRNVRAGVVVTVIGRNGEVVQATASGNCTLSSERRSGVAGLAMGLALLAGRRVRRSRRCRE